ncbi:MAG: hypothetical protein SRB2_02154 [Desulfobacteraceae bacterium Eth-SRB2]|nr:MAG: hypothetical protein SRB2_02154 [Desulfobacteraceae bacterium Eth-SRB2]
MSYINEKLIGIERHAKNLLNQEASTDAGIEQELVWILGATKVIKSESKKLYEHNKLLFEIKEIIGKGVDPAITVKDIENILKSL